MVHFAVHVNGMADPAVFIAADGIGVFLILEWSQVVDIGSSGVGGVGAVMAGLAADHAAVVGTVAEQCRLVGGPQVQGDVRFRRPEFHMAGQTVRFVVPRLPRGDGLVRSPIAGCQAR